MITPGSRRKVWWLCNQCPHGHPHNWLSRVDNRSHGNGCPQCSGRKVCKHNSLATIAPQAAALWDFAKNSCTPDDMTAYSHSRAHWKCRKCGHDWDAHIDSVVVHKTGCPQCNAGGVPQADGSRLRAKHPTFEQCQHPLLAEWDHQRNAAEGIFPNNTTLRSHKRVHWLCRQCSAAQLHRWVQSPNARLDKFGSKRLGCPICAGHVGCKCNSLQTQFPAIAAEWDYERNEGSPEDYSAFSHHTAWWRSPAFGSWQQTINGRTGYEHQKTRRAHARDL